MQIVDFIFLGILVGSVLLGLLFGFGKQLNFITKGIKGIIFSIFICYLIFGFVMGLPFVQTLVSKFKAKAAAGNPFIRFLLTIRIDIVVCALVLFVVVQIVRKILVLIIGGVMESGGTVMHVINKSFGVLLTFAWLCGIGLFVLQMIYLAKGNPAPSGIAGSVFKLDAVYRHNPLTSVSRL